MPSDTRFPRFGIGEWYGHSFVNLSAPQQRRLAELALKGGTANAPPCPFKSADGSQKCHKPGGVCSLRLYQLESTGNVRIVDGADGELRVMCPSRFRQDDTIYREVGATLLGTAQPKVVSEVRFLQRVARESADALPRDEQDEASSDDLDRGKEDVGNIDNVLVHPTAEPIQWCALELQAVYFSGPKMAGLFRHIREHRTAGLPFPEKLRRPDYRSSGPKRLMPQLQIKVPTLRRWGKKMAVVVDRAWFRTNVVGVPSVGDRSNCDIAWFTVGFDEKTDPATLTVDAPRLQTLERCIEGLTGGFAVSLPEFEKKVREKLTQMTRPRRPRRRGDSSST